MEVYEKLDAGCEEGGDEGGKERRGDGDATAQNTNCHDKEYYPNSGAKTKDEHERQTANETPTHDYSTKRQRVQNRREI